MSDLHENSILLVDDESDITTLVEVEARKLIKDVYVANTPSKAIEIAKAHRIDVAIVDVNMPEMTGLELIGKLKEINPGTACIVLSAVDTKENIQEALRIGACDFIEKPFTKIYLKISMLRGLERYFYDAMANDMLDLLVKMNALKNEDLKDLTAPSKRLRAIKQGFGLIKQEVLSNRKVI